MHCALFLEISKRIHPIQKGLGLKAENYKNEKNVYFKVSIEGLEDYWRRVRGSVGVNLCALS